MASTRYLSTMTLGQATVAVLALLVAACGSSDATGNGAADISQTGAGGANGGGGFPPCDPASPHEESTTVGATLAVGADASGTYYVVTTDDRFFLSAGSALTERDVDGSGEDGDAVRTLLSTTLADGSAINVEVDVDRATTRMGVLAGPLPSTKFFTIGEMGTELTVVDPSTIASWPATQIIAPQLQHFARLDDGRALVVVSPAQSGVTEADFLVFFGSDGALEQCVNAGYSRGLSIDGYDNITFELAGMMVQAQLQNAPNGTGSVTLDGAAHPTTELSAVPADAVFSCFAK